MSIVDRDMYLTDWFIVMMDVYLAVESGTSRAALLHNLNCTQSLLSTSIADHQHDIGQHTLISIVSPHQQISELDLEISPGLSKIFLGL